MKDDPSWSVRLSADDRDQVRKLMEARGISRSEALRLALVLRIPLALQSTSINVRPIVSLLEFATAGIGIMIRENHSDYEEDLKDVVNERVERFHG